MLCLLFQVGAPEISPDQGFLSVDDLADQVAEVVDYFGINEVIGLGATAGAYVLSLFAVNLSKQTKETLMAAFLSFLTCNRSEREPRSVQESQIRMALTKVFHVVQCKYPDRALGLILVSPVAQCASWTEWLQNQVTSNMCHRFNETMIFLSKPALTLFLSPDETGTDVWGLVLTGHD